MYGVYLEVGNYLHSRSRSPMFIFMMYVYPPPQHGCRSRYGPVGPGTEKIKLYLFYICTVYIMSPPRATRLHTVDSRQ